MFKKYDYRLIHSYKSYTIKEICRLYKDQKLHDKTVRAWIKTCDLDAIVDGNKLLIYGAVLKKFLKNRNKGHKRQLGINEFFCFKCKSINPPLENTIISIKIQNNGSFQAYGLCPNCAFEMKRLYKHAECNKIMDCFSLEVEALIVLSDSSCSASNTHPNEDQITADLESQIESFSHISKKSINTSNLDQSTKESNYE